MYKTSKINKLKNRKFFKQCKINSIPNSVISLCNINEQIICHPMSIFACLVVFTYTERAFSFARNLVKSYACLDISRYKRSKFGCIRFEMIKTIFSTPVRIRNIIKIKRQHMLKKNLKRGDDWLKKKQHMGLMYLIPFLINIIWFGYILVKVKMIKSKPFVKNKYFLRF